MNDPVTTSCHCPGKPHERDEFTLTDDLPIEAGIAAASALASGSNPAGRLVAALLRNGAITAWNLVDDEGNAVPVTPETVAERVTWMKGGVELSSAALQRYVNSKGAPFGSATSTKKNGKPSGGGRTARSTSAKTPSSAKSPPPSA